MKRGFTLLEIILAVSVLALVGTMIYGGFSQTALNKARIEEDVDHSRIIHMALERMARELTMAFVSTHVNPSLDLRVVDTAFIGKDNGKDDRIDFTSFSHRRLYRNARESDQNEISYFVTEHPDEPGVQVLARRDPQVPEQLLVPALVHDVVHERATRVGEVGGMDGGGRARTCR